MAKRLNRLMATAVIAAVATLVSHGMSAAGPARTMSPNDSSRSATASHAGHGTIDVTDTLTITGPIGGR